MSALQLLFAALLVLGNGYFVAAEFALISVRRSQIEPLAARQRSARTVLYALEHLPQMMAAAQFGVTVCSLTLGAVAEPTVAHLLEPVFSAARLPEGLVHPVGYVLALALVVFLHLVIGEMVPKNLAMAAPERTALRLSPALVGFARVFRPVIAVLGASARVILRAFRVEPKDEVDSVFTSAELTVLVEDARRAGLLDPDEQERLEDALELGTRPVTDVLLTPGELVTLAPSATPREIEELTVRTGYSRFPVAAPARGPDAAPGYLGYLHVKDVLDAEDVDRPVPQRLWRPMTTLRADLPLDDALTSMRRTASHLAAVVDAGGKVLGLVALEDVLEMLVGEVRDPAHRDAEVPAPAAPGATELVS
ncbi:MULTISPECIES: hemolysin family protein [unclassified Streptomyces]|uniref:hemolysin family protein n=1 Tax=unclassified Streptomyces TaxID=2593676 RepID=UPI002E28D6DD|nr:hemolysin family protein [Streptomyces sp. NBC_00223]